MNDQQLGPLLESWLKDSDALPSDVGRSMARIESLLSRTPQRGRWWPLPSVERLIGPSVGRMPAGGFTMFSALKFIAAAVIVALFGGFLLTGILTTLQEGDVPPAAVTEPPSPMTTEELLSGMVTEEVEPGVLRVLNDGVRDLPYEGRPCMVVARQDSSVWLQCDGDIPSSHRLGSPESDAFFEDWDRMAPDGTLWRSDTRWVAPDGTDWVPDEKGRVPEGVRGITRLHAFEDGSWTVRAEGPKLREWTIAPDGTVWGAYRNEDRKVAVARLGADGWEPLAAPPIGSDLFVTRGGELWVGGDLGGYLELHDDGSWRALDGRSLWRYREDDGAWDEVTVDAVVHHPAEQRVRVGPDGTVWFAGAEPLMVDGEPVLDPDVGWGPKPGDPFLMRFDGTEWQRWGPADGVPQLGRESTPPELMPTPDGGLWLKEVPHSGCRRNRGLAHFDGATWSRFLQGRCIESVDMAPDGALWLMSRTDDQDDTFDLYVITHEAVAAAE